MTYKYTREDVYTFTFNTEVAENEGPGRCFINTLRIEVSYYDDDDTPDVYVQAFGIPATSKGTPDKRTKKGRVRPNNAWKFKKALELARANGLDELARLVEAHNDFE